jgi:sec-independent protein translocase protein TatC
MRGGVTVTHQAHNLKIVGSIPTLARTQLVFMINIYKHWKELQIRFFYIFFSVLMSLVCFYWNGDLILYVLAKPFLVKNLDKVFIFTTMFEGFLSVFCASVFFSFFITLPLFYYILFDFLKKGFFKKEKILIQSFMRSSMFFSFLSFLFMYFIFFPLMLSFFLSFEILNEMSILKLYMQPKISDYVIFFVSCFGSCVSLFHLPVVFSSFLYFKVFSLDLILRNRRFLILSCFSLGCFFSPPDVLSQFFIAVPLFMIFEFVVYYHFLAKHYNV